MKYQNIGNLNQVSSICLGGGTFGSQMNESQSCQLLDTFLEAGGNFIDSAHIYGVWDKNGLADGCGNSEMAIGRWMKSRGCRDQVIIGTKGGHPDFATGDSCMTPQWVAQHLQESLDRLQTDFIDIYYFHRDDRNIPIEEILEWMKEPIESGKIKQLACSNWRMDRFIEAREVAAKTNLPLLATNQIGWSCAHSNKTYEWNKYGELVGMDRAIWEIHVQKQIPLVAYNSQAGGYFAKLDASGEGVFESKDCISKKDPSNKYHNELTQTRYLKSRQIGKKKGFSTNQVALAWMLSQSFPTFPIIGSKTPEQLQDSLHALKVDLNNDEVEDITANWI